MKNLITILLVAASLVFCTAASAPVVADTLMRIQCDPASGSASAFFQKATTIDGQIYAQPWDQVSWSVTSTRTVTYTYNGQSVTESYAQVMSAVIAIANQERANPSP